MKLKESILTPNMMSTYRVGHEELPVHRCIKLPIMFIREGPNDKVRFTSTMIKWLVVDVPSSYNAIID